MKKESVQLGKVEETLLITLYSRAVETKKKRALLVDPKAVEMVDSIDYDFQKFKGSRTLFTAVLRTAMLDQVIKAFIAKNPDGTIIEIGPGLNTRFERLDNGKLHWVEVDLPESMALRQKFFADEPRRTMLACSVLDPAWVAAVKRNPPPYFFVAEAVLLYLEQSDVNQALSLLSSEFPGALVAFDSAGRRVVAAQDKHDVMSKVAARFRWACDDPREIERWGLGLRLIESRTLADAQQPLRPLLPFSLKYVAPLLFKAAMDAYRLNVFEVVRH